MKILITSRIILSTEQIVVDKFVARVDASLWKLPTQSTLQHCFTGPAVYYRQLELPDQVGRHTGEQLLGQVDSVRHGNHIEVVELLQSPIQLFHVFHRQVALYKRPRAESRADEGHIRDVHSFQLHSCRLNQVTREVRSGLCQEHRTRGQPGKGQDDPPHDRLVLQTETHPVAGNSGRDRSRLLTLLEVLLFNGRFGMLTLATNMFIF